MAVEDKAAQAKKRWRKQLYKRLKRLGPVADLGQNDPILIWFSSWRDIPEWLDHPFQKK